MEVFKAYLSVLSFHSEITVSIEAYIKGLVSLLKAQ